MEKGARDFLEMRIALMSKCPEVYRQIERLSNQSKLMRATTFNITLFCYILLFYVIIKSLLPLGYLLVIVFVTTLLTFFALYTWGSSIKLYYETLLRAYIYNCESQEQTAQQLQLTRKSTTLAHLVRRSEIFVYQY